MWVCAAGSWLLACCAGCRPGGHLRKANKYELAPLPDSQSPLYCVHGWKSYLRADTGQGAAAEGRSARRSGGSHIVTELRVS